MAGKVKSADARQSKRSRYFPRQPSQERGLVRYEALVDSVDVLLRAFSPDEVGLYQIAEHAGVPKASVYHFFPTTEAAFLALAQRYLRGFTSLERLPVHYAYLDSWQNLIRWTLMKVAEYYNANPPAMKLFLGRCGGLETRRAELEYNSETAAQLYLKLNTVFHMPFIKNSEKMLHIKIEMADAILAMSFLKHGTISDDYRDQACSAAIAYCRLFLPEHVEVRRTYIEAIGQRVSVVIDPTPPVPADPSGS